MCNSRGKSGNTNSRAKDDWYMCKDTINSNNEIEMPEWKKNDKFNVLCMPFPLFEILSLCNSWHSAVFEG